MKMDANNIAALHGTVGLGQQTAHLVAAAPNLAVPPYRFASELVRTHTALRPPLVHGLLRLGETMNVIAPPKNKKSWLTNDLALSIVTGKDWLGFRTKKAGY